MRRLAWALAVVLTLAACGQSQAEAALDDTDDNLAKITSGDLHLHLAASAANDRPVGFEISGPFALPADERAAEDGALPVARLRRVRLAGEVTESSTFLSTGRQAFVEVDGIAYQLPEDQVSGLRARPATSRPTGALGGLDIVGWARNPRLEEAGEADGVPAQRITAQLDVPKALNDLVSLAKQMGGGELAALRPVEGDHADHLRRAVRSARMEVVTGKHDRLLRGLVIEVNLSVPDLENLKAVLGPLAASLLRLELRISAPNRPVRVDPPPRSRPLSELKERQP